MEKRRTFYNAEKTKRSMPRRRNEKKKRERARRFWENSATWTPSKRLTALWRRNLPVAVNASKNWKTSGQFPENRRRSFEGGKARRGGEPRRGTRSRPKPVRSRYRAEETAQKFDTAKEKTENELYEAARNSEAVRLRIIGDYLSSLRGADAPLMRGGTGTLAPSPVRAKSISEAGTMALNYFKKDHQA